MINGKFLLYFCIAQSILLAGCGKTEDDRREEIFLNNFSEAIENKDACAAHRIATGRFMYTPASDENQRKLNTRMREWQDRTNESAIACKKNKWQQVKVNIEAERENLNKLLSLKRVSATYIGDSLRLDEINRNCVVDFYIHNASEFQVVSLSGNWVRQGGYREHFEYRSEKYKVMRSKNIAFNQPIKTPLGSDPIFPGNSKKEAECNFRITEEIKRNGGANIETNIQKIGIILNEKEKHFSLVEIESRVAEIERILKVGYEAINLPNLEDYSILPR
jgi:hypothetical protein